MAPLKTDEVGHDSKIRVRGDKGETSFLPRWKTSARFQELFNRGRAAGADGLVCVDERDDLATRLSKAS